jgi:hypothetical protein
MSFTVCMTKFGKIRWAGYVARIEGMIIGYNTLFGKPEVETSFRRCRWDDNIEMLN